MRRLAYLVFGLVVTLSLALVVHPSRTALLPSISDAHAAAVSIVLSGCVVSGGSCLNVGWNGTTSKPNPPIMVAQGDIVSIALSTGDGISHEFQLDLDNDGGESADCGTTDPCSQPFPPTTTFMFTVMANPATYTYYCIFHTIQMHASFTVNPGSTVGGVVTSPSNSVIIIQYITITSAVLVAIITATLYVARGRRKTPSNSKNS